MFRLTRTLSVWCLLMFAAGCADVEKSVRGLPDDFTKAYEDTKKAVLPGDSKAKPAAKAPEAKKPTEPAKPKEPPAPPPTTPPSSPPPPPPAPPRDLARAPVKESERVPVKDPERAPVKKPPAEEYIRHQVQAGETMGSIAKWYNGKTNAWRDIAAANPGIDPDKLREGQVIKVPVSLAVLHKAPPNHPSTASPPDGEKASKESDDPQKHSESGSKPIFGPK